MTRIIRYRRGHIKLLNRADMEEGTCECYDVIRKEFDLLVDGVRECEGELAG